MADELTFTPDDDLWVDEIQWFDMSKGATKVDPPGRWERFLNLVRRRPDRRFMVMNVATSVIDGSYIGSPGDDPYSQSLFGWLREHRIKAQRRVGGDPLDGTANIGYEPARPRLDGEAKNETPCWWGWSHRGTKSFRPGDVIGRNHEFRIEYPQLYPEGHVIKDMRAAKLAASHFAEMVG